MAVQEIMTETETIEAQSERASSAPEFSGKDMRRYLLKMLSLLLLLYAIPFFMVRSDFYERWNLSFYSRPLNYAFDTAGQNADVVIFGDSTALLGINPSQISSALGVKVLNLVNTQPSLIVNNDLSLRRYLARNRAPRLIVFYFAPWDFDYGHIRFDARPIYEGEELLARQGTAKELFDFLQKHPMDGIVFPLRFYSSSWQLMLHRVSHPNQEAQLSTTLGHVANTDATVLPDTCRYPKLLVDNIRFDWVRALGKSYETPETKILFYPAPVPACSNVSEVMGRPYQQLPAAQPHQVPPSFFSNDIRYIHPLPLAVPELSRQLAEAVGSTLKVPAGK